MILRIEPDAHVPPYEQIRSQVATMAATGVLAEGTRLPPIRQLAADLGLAGGTVARAYRELEQQGVIATRGRHGTFVLPPRRADRSDEGLDDAARSFAVRATQLGAGETRALDAVRSAFESLAATG
jgi:DNA-binding transcriptional regulator YhcF (GntR family)